MKSETIGKLAEALSKAQGAMSHAHRDKANPYFKSKYADLASCWDACREPLSKNGLSVSQIVHQTEKGMILESMLMHISGEWISGELPIIVAKQDAQSLGSAITYMRRFALCALVGIAPSDDDGESAMGRTVERDFSKAPVDLTAEKTTRLKNLLAGAGINGDYLEKQILPRDYKVNRVRSMTEAQFEMLERQLERLALEKAQAERLDAALVK